VANDEPELLKLIGDVLDLADGGKTTWALDMTGGEPGLLIALLVNHGQELVYIPGIAVNRATDSYRGQGKTDARDARVIADQARMRRDLQPIRPGDEATLELRLLTDHRVDLVADRTRTTNRLKALLNSMCFRPRRHLMTAPEYRTEMTTRFAIWDQIVTTPPPGPETAEHVEELNRPAATSCPNGRIISPTARTTPKRSLRNQAGGSGLSGSTRTTATSTCGNPASVTHPIERHCHVG
jgi:hypothetical protein